MKLSQFNFLLVFSVPSLVHAVNNSIKRDSGFTYNEDILCTYPFEAFDIQDITCAKTASHIVIEGVTDQATSDSDSSICHYGDRMEVSGEVTTLEAISNKEKLVLNVCFKSNMAQWYNTGYSKQGEKCIKYSTNIDLTPYNAETGNQNSYASQYNGYVEDMYEYRNNNPDFLPAGTYSWSAILNIPARTWSFSSIASVSVDLSFQPKTNFLGPQADEDGKKSYKYSYNDLPWHTYRADCTATFAGVVYEDESSQYYSSFRYTYAATALMVLSSVGIGAYLVKERKISCAHCGPLADDEKDEEKATMGDDASVLEETKGYNNMDEDVVSKNKAVSSLVDGLKSFDVNTGDDISCESNFYQLETSANAAEQKQQGNTDKRSGFSRIFGRNK